MDNKQTGAWIIHHTNKLNSILNNVSSEYDAIQNSGKAGLLLSALSASDEQTMPLERAKYLARIANISNLEFSGLIDILKKQQLLDTSSNEVAVLGLTNHSVLQHTAEIFENEGGTPLQKASLALAEEVSIAPKLDSDVFEKISDLYKLSTGNTQELFRNSEEFGFIDCERIDDKTKLFFNGNLFRRDNLKKVSKILDNLNEQEKRLLSELNDKLDSYGCISYNDAIKILGSNDLYEKVFAIGLFDISFLSNENGRIGFITKPSAFQKFGSNAMLDDTFDLAKAFISSITYGMRNSYYTRGKITQVDALLRKLISGGEVGPVEAIGKDYNYLELKGVIKVRLDQKYSNRFYMRLLKKEIGELALQILTTGSAHEYSLNLPNVQGSISQYETPEYNRVVTRRKQIKENPKATQDILLSLRTGGI